LADNTWNNSQLGRSRPQKPSRLEIVFAVIAGCSFAVSWLFFANLNSNQHKSSRLLSNL